jgi:hypothetical protein
VAVPVPRFWHYLDGTEQGNIKHGHSPLWVIFGISIIINCKPANMQFAVACLASAYALLTALQVAG